jgi:hypothetical protein
MEMKKLAARMADPGALNYLKQPFLITLANEEIITGAMKGVTRAESKLHMGGNIPPRWSLHIETALAEIAIYKAIERNIHPSGFVNFDSGVAIGINGRIRVIPVLAGNHGSPLIVKSPINDAIYVHVIVAAPEYTITGWAWGKDITAAPVSQESLRPIIELYRATH